MLLPVVVLQYFCPPVAVQCRQVLSQPTQAPLQVLLHSLLIHGKIALKFIFILTHYIAYFNEMPCVMKYLTLYVNTMTLLQTRLDV